MYAAKHTGECIVRAERLDILDVLAALQQVRQQDEVVDFARARRVERVKEGFGFGRHFVEIKRTTERF